MKKGDEVLRRRITELEGEVAKYRKGFKVADRLILDLGERLLPLAGVLRLKRAGKPWIREALDWLEGLDDDAT